MKGFLRALALLVASLPAAAQYPTKPVRMVVAFAPGGGVDITARFVAAKLTERWGKPVVVENRPGAAGNIGTEAVARSAPDGYTLLMAFSSYASNAALYPSLPFDVTRDFASITLVATAPVLVVASPKAPAKTLGELIEYARAHPGAIRYASSGIGTPVHLGGEMMSQLTGIRMTHVPYKGIAPAMTAMLAGETDVTYAAVVSANQQLRNGRLRALALASARRYPTLPDVPTTAEAGLPGFEMDYWYALFGPAGTPHALVQQIQRDTAAILKTPETKDYMQTQGSIAVGSTPEALDAVVRRDLALWSKVVKTGGVKAE